MTTNKGAAAAALDSGFRDKELDDLVRMVTSSRRTKDEELLAAYLLEELSHIDAKAISDEDATVEKKRIATLYHNFLHPLGHGYTVYGILHSAVMTGKLTIVRHIIDCGVRVDVDENGPLSAMALACQRGHLEIAKFLVERGASVMNAEAPYLYSMRSSMLLAQCESTCDLRFVQWLVESAANIDGAPLTNCTPVIAAVMKGSVLVVKYLVAKGARAEMTLSNGENAAYVAALHGELEILKYFVDNQLCGSNEDGSKMNLMIGAARGGHVQVAKYLLQRKELLVEDAHVNVSLPIAVEAKHRELSLLLIPYCTDVMIADVRGNQALYFAIETGMLEVVESLLGHGADVVGPVSFYQCSAVEAMAEFGRLEMLRLVRQRLGGERMEYGYSLFLAADNGHTDVVVFLLDAFPEAFGIDTDIGGAGDTALMLAAHNGCVELVEVLVQRGANVNKASENGRTALLYAATEGNFEVVRYLCEQGARIEHADSWHITALLAATEVGHLSIVEYLLEECQANTNVVTESGLTCLAYAINGKRADIVRVLLAHGANPDGVDGQRAVPVCEAVLSNDCNSVELLLQHEADLNVLCAVQVGEEGSELEISPLIIAAGCGDLAMVKCLCENGAEVDLTTSLRESALSVATAKYYQNIVEYLIEARGADVLAESSFGLTLVEIAGLYEYYDLVELLYERETHHLMKTPAEILVHRERLDRRRTERAISPEKMDAYRARKLAYDRLFDASGQFEFTRR